jgi:hypothetical protein
VFPRVLLLIFVALVLPAPASAAGKDRPVGADERDAPLDLSEIKDKLILLTDGKQHFVAVVPFGDFSSHLYYGDGKRFYAQRVGSGSSEGTEAWDRTFWEPRVTALWQGGVGLRKGKYAVQCGDRVTELKQVDAEEQAKMLAAASFFAPLWNHRAYALARDNKGIYYFVDRLREPENNKSFRLFAGPRGNLKPLKMTNVVSDSQGDIFTTKKGELRLVLDRKHSVWFAGKAETELVYLPLEDNRIMIYTDLGVYAGQRLGTPCDDLL